jgi:hypothetical protein
MTAKKFTFLIWAVWLAAIVILIVTILATPRARAADLDDCKSYANRGSALALRQLLGFPFIDVAAGRFLYRKAYSFCLLQDEVPAFTFTPEEQPIVDGQVVVFPPMKPASDPPEVSGKVSTNLERSVPAVPALTGQPLCVKYGKRTVYKGKRWRCVK